MCEDWEEVLKILSPAEYNSSPLGHKRFSDDDSVKSYEVQYILMLSEPYKPHLHGAFTRYALEHSTYTKPQSQY